MESYKRLNSEERELISILLYAGYSFQDIGKLLNRSLSTISREVLRNGGRQAYRAFPAHSTAKEKQRYAHRRELKIEQDQQLKSLILEKLRLFWSPEQISNWLRDTMNTELCHETIYQFIYIQCKGELKKELISCLRQRKPRRQNRKGVTEKRGVIPNMISIDQRPEEVASRSIPGHWEGDLIIGKDHKSAIGTIVERQTRYVLLVKLKDKDAVSVRKAFSKKLLEMPESWRKTLTYDRGKEMADHAKFTISTGMEVFFCDPHSPWQRGSNENTNGLLRQFFPRELTLARCHRLALNGCKKL
jgi:transposase, IS30 family